MLTVQIALQMIALLDLRSSDRMHAEQQHKCGEIPWGDLETRGYVVLRGYFSTDELDRVRSGYTDSARGETIYVSRTAKDEVLKPLKVRLARVLEDIRAHTNVESDTFEATGAYFPTEYTSFGWHTDHKSFYLVQNHYHYLNFWIPVIKPEVDKSGLGLIPMDKLQNAEPAVHRTILGRGAAGVRDNVLRIELDGMIRALPCSEQTLNEIGEAPDLAVGDLIVARCDLLHKTQDTETPRVAVAMRAYRANQTLSLHDFLSGSPEKHLRILAERSLFVILLAAFWWRRRRWITLAEYYEFSDRVHRNDRFAIAIHAVAKILFPLVLHPHRYAAFRRVTPSHLTAFALLIRTSREYRRAVRAEIAEQSRASAAGERISG